MHVNVYSPELKFFYVCIYGQDQALSTVKLLSY